jgi:uncharacterized protein YutE (UPF0331/DUF86 family)
MVDKEVLQRKLQKLQEYLDEIAYYKELTWSEYKGNTQIRRAVERLIQLIVDVAVDINTHSIVDAGGSPPDNAYDSFIKAAEMSLIDDKLAMEIAPSTGERNILVHDYEAIDDLLIFESIPEVTEMYKKYLKNFLKLI